MRLIFAIGANIQMAKFIKDFGGKNLLYSYAMGLDFDKKVLPILEPDDFFIIDSGAFTTWTKGKDINLDEYIAFCKHVQSIVPCPTRFVNLDVIPGRFGVKPTQSQVEQSAEKGWQNYEKMKAAGLKVIHIFHQGEDFQWLRKLKDSSDYIGISPANDMSVKKRLAWLKQCYSIVRNDVKTHIFGLTAFSVLSEIPTYSADSSSWNAASRFGQMINYKDFKTTTFRYRDREKAIENEFDISTVNSNYRRCKMNIQSMIRLQEDMTRLWAARGITWKD